MSGRPPIPRGQSFEQRPTGGPPPVPPVRHSPVATPRMGTPRSNAGSVQPQTYAGGHVAPLGRTYGGPSAQGGVGGPPDAPPGGSAPETGAPRTAGIPKDAPIPVSLKLGSMSFSMTNGKWTAMTPLENAPTADPEEVASLRAQLTELQDKHDAVQEEKNLLEFRNTLLKEMLAVSQLDCERRDKDLETERLRVEALKWELTRQAAAGATD